MGRIAIGIGLVLLLLLAGLAAFLAEAHWEMRGIAPELPEPGTWDQLASVTSGPDRIHFINTASQSGSGPATVGHPAFLLRWPDGRAFLIDAGMERDAAVSFGRPMEWLMDADPMQAHGSVAEQLGPVSADIDGVAFTHLHLDHTGGLASLCEGRSEPLAVYQTSWQADHENYSTRPGNSDIDSAGCAARKRLDGSGVYEVPGFPGLVAVAAGGHTPGSTIYLVHVAGTTWVLAGDVTNFMESLRLDRPKPALYSLLIVPEVPERLGRLRRWLSQLDARTGFTVQVSHDLDALQASGMPAWPGSGR